MNDDRFADSVIFNTGVIWNPTDHKPLDQTPYLAYLEKEEDKVRAEQGLGLAESQAVHHWRSSVCQECEANVSWCNNPHVHI